MEWRSLGPVAAGAVLLLGGAWRVAQSSGEGWPLLIMGAVCVGAWIALHARDGGDGHE